MSLTNKAHLALLYVSAIWGLTFPLIRSALSEVDPFQFVFYRFLLASIAFFCLMVFRKGQKFEMVRSFWPGVALGMMAWTSYLTQTIGMQTVPSGRAAFITGLSVIFVPFTAPLFRAGNPTRIDIWAALLAVAGLYLLTEPNQGGLSKGDLWIVACAVTYSFYIVLLQKVLSWGKTDSASLAFFQVVGVMVASAILLPFADLKKVPWTAQVWVALGVCSVLATVGTFWLQAAFQKHTTPQHTALIFSLEPIFAALFGYILLEEVLSGTAVVGAGLILLSVAGVVGMQFVNGRIPRRC